MKYYVLFIFSFYRLLTVYSEEEEKFVATSEWTEIKEGQSIPRGLHVRMNFQTGIREAKLMSPEDKDSDSNVVVVKDDDGSTSIDVEAMEDGLKNIVNSKDTMDTLSSKFKTMDEIKQSLKGYDIKSEALVIKDKMALLSQTMSDPNIIILLEELEDLAHKYDNGKLMIQNGWMEQIIRHFHSNNKDVYRAAVRVVSASASSNPEVQKYCIQKGYLSILVSKIYKQEDSVAKTTTFGIASMIRNFPAGVEHFNNLFGFTTLSSKLIVSKSTALDRSILSLFNDLLTNDKERNKTEIQGYLEASKKLLCKKIIQVIDKDVSDATYESLYLFTFIRDSCGSLADQVVVKLRETVDRWSSEDKNNYNISDGLIQLILKSK